MCIFMFTFDGPAYTFCGRIQDKYHHIYTCGSFGSNGSRLQRARGTRPFFSAAATKGDSSLDCRQRPVSRAF